MALLALLTPVEHDQADALRAYLRRLRDPLAGTGTHFARFVVMNSDRPHLLFSSKFDGQVNEYLSRLAQRDEAVAIWAHCARPKPACTDALSRYFASGHDRVEPSYVIDVVPDGLTVEEINAALEVRAALSSFAMRAGALDAIALAHEFRQLPFVQRMFDR